MICLLDSESKENRVQRIKYHLIAVVGTAGSMCRTKPYLAMQVKHHKKRERKSYAMCWEKNTVEKTDLFLFHSLQVNLLSDIATKKGRIKIDKIMAFS